MKNIINKKYFWILAVLMAMLTSCKQEFLETKPNNAVDESSATSTADNLMLIINGMHRNMFVRQFDNTGGLSQGQTGQGSIMIICDAVGDDLVFPTTGNNWFISTLRWIDQGNEQSSLVFYPYSFYYSMIKNANIVINKGGAASGSQTTKDIAFGEAYAFRAFCYYQLVQFYGKRYVAGGSNTQLGVPLRLDTSETPLKRATVEEVYTQINTDLDKALSLLAGKTRTAKSHFDENIVRGLMARVALTQGNYTKAATQAKLARTNYSLMTNIEYTAGFNKLSNTEWMWGSEITADQTDYFGNFGAYMSRNYSSTNIRSCPKAINKLLYSKFPTTDIRTKNFDPTGKHTALALPSNFTIQPYTSQKFLAVSTGDSRCDVPYMRAAEMYLIEAEALARNGDEAGSKAVFNSFTKNRNPSYAGATTIGQAYIDEILTSRRLELWGEGFRLFDLKRLNLPLDRGIPTSNHSSAVVNNVNQVALGDPKWEFLIPKSEIDANQGLVIQNPK